MSFAGSGGFNGFPLSALFQGRQTMNSPMMGNSMGHAPVTGFAPPAFHPPPPPGAAMVPGGMQPSMPPPQMASMPPNGGPAPGGTPGGMSPLLMAMMSGGQQQASQPAASPVGAMANATQMPMNAMMLQRLGLFGKS